MEPRLYKRPEVEVVEISVPHGAIGVVSEITAFPVGQYQIYLIVFPGKPLPPADYGDNAQVLARKLYVLRPGESCTVRVSGLCTGFGRVITNEGGIARIERTGHARCRLGPATRYWGPSDSGPVKPR